MVQYIKKSRDPRWEEEFQFVCEEPPTNDKMHVEVFTRPPSISIHPKVQIDVFISCKILFTDKQKLIMDKIIIIVIC